MRIGTTLLTLLCVTLPAIADTGIKGTVDDAQTGRAVEGANILLRDQAIFVVSGSDGVFTISDAAPGADVLEIIASGYDERYVDVTLSDGMVRNLGEVRLTPAGFESSTLDSDNFLFNEEDLLDDEGIGQQVGTIQSA